MKTPKEYVENLKKGIITEEMLDRCLYSVNKRAKNWRDKKREYKGWHYAKHDYAALALSQEERMYRRKEILLSAAKPVCIHREPGHYPRIRIYDYDEDFLDRLSEHILKNDIVWTNSYLDRDYYKEVEFFDFEDRNKPVWRYYLFYQLSSHSYHTPIKESDIEKYDLPVITIDKLETQGDGISGLLSVQFVDKVISLITGGQFEYLPVRQEEEKACGEDIPKGSDGPEKKRDYAEIADGWRSWSSYLNVGKIINLSKYLCSDAEPDEQEKQEMEKLNKTRIRTKLRKKIKKIAHSGKCSRELTLAVTKKTPPQLEFVPEPKQIDAMIAFCEENGYTFRNCIQAVLTTDETALQKMTANRNRINSCNRYAKKLFPLWCREVLSETEFTDSLGTLDIKYRDDCADDTNLIR